MQLFYYIYSTDLKHIRKSETLVNNQILLGLNPPRISVRFLQTNILFTSVFVNILSPPPKR